ncbi:DUF4297 domain-containing protein [Puteibacter caeruleilacunae]|nr:DUF4297 domain-containing protein [Puteibacter caeruleilacunae]
MSDNPLFAPQREKAGSTTYRKYNYQYHWALCKVIEEHSDRSEYAIFVEMHEDVVLADSLNRDKVKFVFNQVKTTKDKYSETTLIKRKNNKPSVLAKLIESCNCKEYSCLITSINLVAANGFSLTLKETGVDLKLIKVSDLGDDSIEKMSSCIKEELGCEIPESLQFVIPTLPEKETDNVVIGKVALLLNKLYPNCRSEPVDIYRTLMDELRRKGEDMFDYKNWDDALKNKSLTSETVTQVLNTFTTSVKDTEMNDLFREICEELGLSVMQRSNLKKSFQRYKTRRIGARNTMQLSTTQNICDNIHKFMHACDNKMEILIELVGRGMDKSIAKQFVQKEDKDAAIICEYVIMTINE